MFDIGFSELVVVGLVALIVLGPKRLPEVARAAGRWTARLRRFINDTRSEIDREIKDADITALKDVHREIIETRDLLSKSASEIEPSLNEISARDQPAKPSIGAGAPAPLAHTQPTKPRSSKKPAMPKKKPVRKAAPRKSHVRRKARTD